MLMDSGNQSQQRKGNTPIPYIYFDFWQLFLFFVYIIAWEIGNT